VRGAAVSSSAARLADHPTPPPWPGFPLIAGKPSRRRMRSRKLQDRRCFQDPAPRGLAYLLAFALCEPLALG
jgi:hypothetical protein